MSKIVVTLITLLFSTSTISAQEPTGYFTSEIEVVKSNANYVISVKKYSPTKNEIEKVGNPSPKSPMTYLQIPFYAKNISMNGKLFESKLYCLNENGKLIWEKSVGHSEISKASPVIENNGTVYTGESLQDEDKISIQKIDSNGKEVWKTTIDSLENVNSLFMAEDTLYALVSFTAKKRVDKGDGTFYVKEYPIYFFAQLNTETGKLIQKEYQMMANYLTSKGYNNAFINSRQSYYLYKKDSVAFININNQKGASIVSGDIPKDNEILQMAAGLNSFHILTSDPKSNKTNYTIYSDFYDRGEKYKSAIPEKFSQGEVINKFVNKDGYDIFSTFCTVNETSIFQTSKAGATTKFVKLNNQGILCGVFSSNKTITLVYIEGRIKPGEQGKIILKQLPSNN